MSSDPSSGRKWSKEDLYDYLAPMQKYSYKSTAKPDYVDDIILGEKGLLSNVDYQDFKSFKAYLNSNGANDQHYKENLELQEFHGIGPDELLFQTDEYLTEKGITNSSNLLPHVQGSDHPLSDKKLAIFSTRHPFITPSLRSARDVDFFLNYTPSIFASQMVPYLDVELQINRDPIVAAGTKDAPSPATNITSPTIMRFLMGSVPTAGLSAPDRALEEGRTTTSRLNSTDAISTVTSFSGMEMFLMPQVLTNMDTLVSAPSQRLLDVKPFLPFASIESFDVSIANAGAGTIAHKTATMRIKIHDKARLSEFSQFIRPAYGSATSTIITQYGWIAPQGRGSDDMYAEFINKRMLVKDRWMVVNTSFSFDISGQVVLNLTLNNAGVSLLKRAEIAENSYLQDSFNRLVQIHDELAVLNRKLQGVVPLADIRAMQLLDGVASRSFAAAASDEKTQAAVKDIINVLSKYSEKLGYNDAESKRVLGVLNEFIRKEGSASLADKIKAGAKISSIKRFKDGLSGVKDPFMPKDPTNPTAIDKSYFNEDMLKVLSGKNPVDNSSIVLSYDPSSLNALEAMNRQNLAMEFAGSNAKIAAAKQQAAMQSSKLAVASLQSNPLSPSPEEENAKKAAAEASARNRQVAKEENVNKGVNYANALRLQEEAKTAVLPTEAISVGKNVVSFGLIFSRFIAESILLKGTCDELQLVFYSLNENCGPLSGQSVAEFPIDLDKLTEDYSKMLQTSNVVTVEAFLGMLIRTQFNDKRHFAYGMSPAYKPWNREDTLTKNDQKYDSFMLEWSLRYSEFRPPQIEIYAESGVPAENSLSISEKDVQRVGGSGKIIKRIHIYDKQHNPRSVLSNIVNLTDNFVVGAKTKKKETRVDTIKQMIDVKATKTLQALTGSAAAGGKPASSDLEIKSLNGTYVIKKGDTKKLMEFISATAPNIRIGSNGSLVSSANISSKTNDLAAAHNMTQQLKGVRGQGGVLSPTDGLQDPNDMPLRTHPAQLTMQTLGCPAASLYQQFFIDFGTGTTIDNLYNVTQVKHSLTPGKFMTDLTFMYTDAYMKFSGSPQIVASLQEIAEQLKNTAPSPQPAPTPPARHSAPKNVKPAPLPKKRRPINRSDWVNYSRETVYRRILSDGRTIVERSDFTYRCKFVINYDEGAPELKDLTREEAAAFRSLPWLNKFDGKDQTEVEGPKEVVSVLLK